MSAFEAAWKRRWPQCPPLAYEFKDRLSETWVRFHSLPESRRYPDEERDFAELLRRHDTVLGDLVATSPSQRVVVVTAAWSGGPAPDQPMARLRPNATFEMSLEHDEGAWSHFYVETIPWRRGELHDLLREVAVDRASGVIVAGDDLDWLYHPYDGGGDVIARSVEHRDHLRAMYRDWLSPHPSGR